MDHQLYQHVSSFLQKINHDKPLKNWLEQQGYDADYLKSGSEMYQALQNFNALVEESRHQAQQVKASLNDTSRYIYPRFVSHIEKAVFVFDDFVYMPSEHHDSKQLETWVPDARKFYSESVKRAARWEAHDTSLRALEECHTLTGQMLELLSLQKQIEVRYQELEQQKQQVVDYLSQWYSPLAEETRSLL